MNVNRWFKQHKNLPDFETGNGRNKRHFNYKKFSSNQWLMATALAGALLVSVAAAGETSWLSGSTDGETQGSSRLGVDEFAAGELSFGSAAERRSSPSGNQGSDGQDLNLQVNGHSSHSVKADIDSDSDGSSATTVDEDGTLEHDFTSDDGQTSVHVEVKSGSSSSSADVKTNTRIDIDTDSHSSLIINNQNQTQDGGRNSRYNR